MRWMYVSRSFVSSRFTERRNQSFDVKRSNKLRCGRFGRYAVAALQQQAHHLSQNIPSDRTTAQLDYCNGLSISRQTNYSTPPISVPYFFGR